MTISFLAVSVRGGLFPVFKYKLETLANGVRLTYELPYPQHVPTSVTEWIASQDMTRISTSVFGTTATQVYVV